MALGKSAATVIGSFPLGESDRVVTFFSREYGKIRGVAKAARRMKSRFGGALELFTLGQLVFFDTGRSDLVRIDHFDVVRPFARLRSDLERLGQGSWIVECVGRLSGERDRHPALYGLLLRSLRALEGPVGPARVALCFGARCLDTLGYGPRLDRCVECGRTYPFPRARLDESGLVCERCAQPDFAGAVRAEGRPSWRRTRRHEASGEMIGNAISAPAVVALDRLRSLPWEATLALPLGRAEVELRALLDTHLSRLIGQPTRASKFLREVRRLSEISGDRL